MENGSTQGRKKKVLFVITKSNWGGAQRYLYDLATNLPPDEYERVVVCGNASDGTPGQLVEKIATTRIRTILVPELTRDVGFADFAAFRALLSIIKRERPDVLHLNSSKAGGLGALAGRIAGVRRIIFTVHGWPFNEKRNACVRFAIWVASWLTALLSHTVIVVCDSDLRIGRRMPWAFRKIVRIYNGIDVHMQLGSGENIRSAFLHGSFITGTIGELTKNKNQQALIEEAKNNPPMCVAIVGEGEDRAMLERKIKDNNLGARVKLFGFMPASEALLGFDRFALPSLKEGLPYALIEAKAAGLPLVANRVGGVGEILDTELSEFSLERMVEKTIRLY